MPRVIRFDDEPVRPGIGTTCRPSSAPERDTLISDPIRGLHQGQRPCAAQTGRTHGSTRPVVVYVELPLRQSGRPHMTDATRSPPYRWLAAQPESPAPTGRRPHTV